MEVIEGRREGGYLARMATSRVRRAARHGVWPHVQVGIRHGDRDAPTCRLPEQRRPDDMNLNLMRRAPSSVGPDLSLQSYVSWRAACVAVRNAYESWKRCEPALRSFAFDSYCEALDREENAARVHSERTQQVRRVSEAA